MRRSLLLAFAVAAISLTVNSAPASARAEPQHGSPIVTAQGAEVCDEIGDSSASISAVFDYVDDRPVPAPTVIIGDAEIDSGAFSAAALGALELAHADGMITCIEPPGPGEPARTDLDVEICGPPNYGALTAGLQLGDRFVLIGSGLFGFPFDEVIGAELPNMAAALSLASEACVSASVHGSAEDELVEASISTEGCYTVVDRAAEQLVLQDPKSGAQAAFRVTDGSEVPSDLAPGELAALVVTGHRGVDGAVDVGRVDLLDCGPPPFEAPVALPPVSAPAGAPVSAPPVLDEPDDSIPVNVLVLILAALAIAAVGFFAFRSSRS